MTDRETPPCPHCSGKGSFGAFCDGPSGGYYKPDVRCHACAGTGRISTEQADWHRRGKALRDMRVGAMKGLYAEAQRLGFRPAEMSAMENGRADPAPLEAAYGLR